MDERVEMEKNFASHVVHVLSSSEQKKGIERYLSEFGLELRVDDRHSSSDMRWNVGSWISLRCNFFPSTSLFHISYISCRQDNFPFSHFTK